MSELAAQGKVVGVIRKGTKYKEWSINNCDLKGSGRGEGCVSSHSKPIQGDLVWKEYEPRSKEAIDARRDAMAEFGGCQ